MTDTGYIRTDGWLNYATVVGTNNSVSWTAGTASLAGRTDRWIHHGYELGIWSPNLVTDEGTFTRVLFAQLYKSYGAEESIGKATYRQAPVPGWAPRPLALVGCVGLGSASSANPFWIATSANVTVADAMASSAVRYGGVVTWEIPICGDLTLPIDAITQPPASNRNRRNPSRTMNERVPVEFSVLQLGFRRAEATYTARVEVAWGVQAIPYVFEYVMVGSTTQEYLDAIEALPPQASSFFNTRPRSTPRGTRLRLLLLVSSTPAFGQHPRFIPGS